MDVDLVKSDIRDLVERISSTMKERDEGLHQVVTLKRQNDDLLEHTVQLEDQVTYQKKRSRTLEEQLKKCELKVSLNDTQLAEQVCNCIVVIYFTNFLQAAMQHSGPENLKKSRPKKLVKSNKSIAWKVFFDQK